MGDCVFCAIVAGDAEAEVLRLYEWAWVISPLQPCTPGHALIVPVEHLQWPGDKPEAVGDMAAWAAVYAAELGVDHNLILNSGPAASQTQPHLHWHYIPRRPGDGLSLPWTGQAVA